MTSADFPILPAVPEGPQVQCGPKPKYPIAELELGEAFVAPVALRGTLSSLAVHHGKTLGRKFSLVSMLNDPEHIVFYRKD